MPAYATITEGQAYVDERLNSEPWEEATDSDRTKALATATKIIDRLNFIGDKSDEDQVNEFPRNGDTTIPQAIKDATTEIAIALLDGVDPNIEYENVFMTAQGYSNVRSTYNRDEKPPHFLAGVPSFVAWTLLHPFLRDPNSVDLDRIS